MKLIRLNEVIACTGLSRTTIYCYMADNRFPKTVSLGARSVAWVESEVQEWIAEKVAERDES